MALVVIPTSLYLVLHLMGWQHPALLWGTDQLYYYPTQIGAIFVFSAFSAIIVGAKDTWAVRLDQSITFCLQQVEREPRLHLYLKILGVSLLITLSYIFRDQYHYLGDSDMWCRVLTKTAQQDKPWSSTFLPDLGRFPEVIRKAFYFQPLDVLIHFHAYRLGHDLFGWTAQDSYEWLSCGAIGVYTMALWAIASSLSKKLLTRLTFFSFFIASGTIQLFFGYGESYTLVTLANTLYLWQSMRYLRGASLLYPTLCLLLAIGLHLSAFSLLPSWLYLIWRKRPFFSLPRPQVLAPLLLASGSMGFWMYTSFYPYPLPLWTPTDEGKYSLFSIGHWMVLLNTILLCSPFGLIWGLSSLFSKRISTPEISFSGLAALGTGSLFFLHDAYMGGRDWDLMSLPTLPWALWGSLCLGLHPRCEHFLRQVRIAIVPLMALHTTYWLGINSNSERAKDRLENLLISSNQPLHYRAFTQGFFHLTIQSDPQQAIPYLRAAIAQAPPDSLDPEGNYRNRYRKYLSEALVLTKNYEEAIEGFDEAYESQVESRLSQADSDFGRARALACFRAGEQYSSQGNSAKATELWSEAVDHCEQLLSLEPDPALYRLLARCLQKLNRLEEAVDAYQRAIALEPDGIAVHHVLGSIFLKLGNRQEAKKAFTEALSAGDRNVGTYLTLAHLYLDDNQRDLALQVYLGFLNHDIDSATSAIYTQVGIQLDSLGYADEATTAYSKALKKDALNATALVNLGWHLYLTGNLGEAVDHYRRALTIQPNSVAQFNLGLAYLRLGKIEEARQTYEEGVERYSAIEAEEIGAVKDLKDLIAQGIQPTEAQNLISTYWK